MEGDLIQTFELFSKRNKVFKFDVLEYDYLPDKLRNQIYYIWKYALGIDYAKGYGSGPPYQAFATIRDTICREHGLQFLYSEGMDKVRECELYLRKGKDIEILLDIIELSILMIEPLRNTVGWPDFARYSLSMNVEDAINELNQRLRENGVGYEFSNEILIRKDSEFLHEEVTKPALYLLQEEGFEGALEEFLEAHNHFRNGEYKSCIVSASNAFESTMKTICAKQGWSVNGTGTASQLINSLVVNELIPSYLETHVNSLRNMLSGISNVRNKKASHGQGENSISVPEHFVTYTLHLCATNIVFLIEAYRDLPKIS